MGLVICGKNKEVAKSGNSKFKTACFNTWLWQFVDKAEGKGGVEGSGLGCRMICPRDP